MREEGDIEKAEEIEGVLLQYACPEEAPNDQDKASNKVEVQEPVPKAPMADSPHVLDEAKAMVAKVLSSNLFALLKMHIENFCV